MSSSVEQESRVDSQVSRALKAVKDPFLRKIAERFQKEPNQILKLSEILGLTTEEEKNAKALVWLKKHEPEKYWAVLRSFKAKNKNRGEEKMKSAFRRLKGQEVYILLNIPGLDYISERYSEARGKVEKIGKELLELRGENGRLFFINYEYVIRFNTV